MKPPSDLSGISTALAAGASADDWCEKAPRTGWQDFVMAATFVFALPLTPVIWSDIEERRGKLFPAHFAVMARDSQALALLAASSEADLGMQVTFAQRVAQEDLAGAALLAPWLEQRPVLYVPHALCVPSAMDALLALEPSFAPDARLDEGPGWTKRPEQLERLLDAGFPIEALAGAVGDMIEDGYLDDAQRFLDRGLSRPTMDNIPRSWYREGPRRAALALGADPTEASLWGGDLWALDASARLAFVQEVVAPHPGGALWSTVSREAEERGDWETLGLLVRAQPDRFPGCEFAEASMNAGSPELLVPLLPQLVGCETLAVEALSRADAAQVQAALQGGWTPPALETEALLALPEAKRRALLPALTPEARLALALHFAGVEDWAALDELLASGGLGGGEAALREAVGPPLRAAEPLLLAASRGWVDPVEAALIARSRGWPEPPLGVERLLSHLDQRCWQGRPQDLSALRALDWSEVDLQAQFVGYARSCPELAASMVRDGLLTSLDYPQGWLLALHEPHEPVLVVLPEVFVLSEEEWRAFREHARGTWTRGELRRLRKGMARAGG